MSLKKDAQIYIRIFLIGPMFETGKLKGVKKLPEFHRFRGMRIKLIICNHFIYLFKDIDFVGVVPEARYFSMHASVLCNLLNYMFLV